MCLVDQLGLAQGAFRDSALRDVDYWYGFQADKQEFGKLIQASLASPPRRVILCHGKWGSGLTHAAYYYANILPNEMPEDSLYSQAQYYVAESPPEGGNAFFDLYKRLIQKITWRRVVQAVGALRNQHGPEELLDRLKANCQSEDYASALAQLSSETRADLSRYLMGNFTATELREFGFSARPTSAIDFAHIFAGVISALAGSEEKSRTRLFIWIDEMEDLVYVRQEYYMAFAQGLTTLFDCATEDVTFLLNFTFSVPEDRASIRNMLGEAILSRVDDHLTIGSPAEDDVRAYFFDLFAANRPEGFERDEFWPFDEEAFALLVRSCAERTPRFCNQFCDKMIRVCMSATEGQPRLPIDAETFRQKAPGVLEDLQAQFE